MERKRDGLLPIGEDFTGQGGPVTALQTSPQPQHHFTQADQVDQLVVRTGLVATRASLRDALHSSELLLSHRRPQRNPSYHLKRRWFLAPQGTLSVASPWQATVTRRFWNDGSSLTSHPWLLRITHCG